MLKASSKQPLQISASALDSIVGGARCRERNDMMTRQCPWHSVTTRHHEPLLQCCRSAEAVICTGCLVDALSVAFRRAAVAGAQRVAAGRAAQAAIWRIASQRQRDTFAMRWSWRLNVRSP